jgi:flagellar protein FlaG
MDNSISMTRALPPSTVKVDAPPRQPAASPSDAPVQSSSPPAPPPPENTPEVSEQEALQERLERVREQISEYASQTGRELEFQVEDSGNVVILVKSAETGEVVRSIPPEEVQRLADALADGEPALVDLRA